ncbi:hypothetical protein [Ruminococcus flavefaciens]|uniref:hypothetical protein n=1 Tax=Ruminococcus flavefaciens TaxID=1265 RepID=UPI003F03151E
MKFLSELMLMTPNAVNKSVNASLNKLKELYYKDSKLFYWRNANWGFEDRNVFYCKGDVKADSKKLKNKSFINLILYEKSADKFILKLDKSL